MTGVFVRAEPHDADARRRAEYSADVRVFWFRSPTSVGVFLTRQ
jgi:hypothetical protein